MIQGGYFVGPHAVNQFRTRIAPHLNYKEARAAIIEGLATTDSIPRLAHSGRGYYLRVRRPYAFRALIGPGEGPLPAVITILRSGKGRGGRRERERWLARRQANRIDHGITTE